jgi:hypothetical protein
MPRAAGMSAAGISTAFPARVIMLDWLSIEAMVPLCKPLLGRPSSFVLAPKLVDEQHRRCGARERSLSRHHACSA